MSDAERLPEDVDGIEGVPLPRVQTRLIGHGAAEAAFLDGYRSGRLHHAWLLAGPEGIGKATFAFRAARFVLAHPDPRADAVRAATDLSVPADHPVFGKLARLAHPDVFLLRRSLNDKGKLRGETAVDDARDLVHLFQTTSGAEGWRVAIVDTADDLTRHAENALLKMLEEPPLRGLFLIVANQPARLLPTIRSRCRRLTMQALGPDELSWALELLRPEIDADRRAEAARYAEGSVRRGLTLLEGGLDLLAALDAVFDRLPDVDLKQMHGLADKLTRKDGEGLRLFREAAADWAARRIRRDVAAGRPVGDAARLADAVAEIEARQDEGDVYNLDKKQLVLSSMAALAAAIDGRRAA